jgi:hypothetical protein
MLSHPISVVFVLSRKYIKQEDKWKAFSAQKIPSDAEQMLKCWRLLTCTFLFGLLRSKYMIILRIQLRIYVLT